MVPEFAKLPDASRSMIRADTVLRITTAGSVMVTRKDRQNVASRASAMLKGVAGRTATGGTAVCTDSVTTSTATQ